MVHSSGAQGRSVHSVILSHPSGNGLVFGLNWMPIMGGVPQELGRRRARLLRATHFLVLGGSAAVVGCGAIHAPRLKGEKRHFTQSRPLYSVAALFAKAYDSGVVAGVYDLPQKGFWMVAVNAGLVLAQTDRLFETFAEAQLALVSLENRFPNLSVLPLQKIDTLALPSWMSDDLKPFARLQRFSAFRTYVVRSAILVLAIGCIYAGWFLWRSAPIPVQASEENAEIRWAEVMRRFASAHAIHRPEHLFVVLHSWQKAPLKPGGWKLNQIVCESVLTDWHCAAYYQRGLRMARSEQLDAAKPADWRLDLIDLDHAVLRWQIHQAAGAFETVSTSTPLKVWMSYLQSVTPVFESIQIGSGTRITIQAPVNPQGVAVEKPPHIKPLTRRSLSVKGPLRSMAALKGLTVPVRWRSAHLAVGAMQGQGIIRSALTVHLIGEIYEVSE